MAITVNDQPHSALDLLWLREAYQLSIPIVHQIPHLMITPDVVSVESSELRNDLTQAWVTAWNEMKAAIANPWRDSIDTKPSNEGPDLSTPQHIRELLGHDRFDHASYEDWSNRTHNSHVLERDKPRTSSRSPERQVLYDLIPAWSAGLSTVVLIPCVGFYAEKLNRTSLLITPATRNNPIEYAKALRSFTTTRE